MLHRVEIHFNPLPESLQRQQANFHQIFCTKLSFKEYTGNTAAVGLICWPQSCTYQIDLNFPNEMNSKRVRDT